MKYSDARVVAYLEVVRIIEFNRNAKITLYGKLY